MSVFLNVLLIEDDPADVSVVEELLKGSPVKVNLTAVDSLTAGVEELESNPYDVVLLDLGLPESTGLETYRRLRKKFPDLAIVVLTGPDDCEVTTAALREGAQDYVVKWPADSCPLTRSMKYACERKRAEEVLRASEEKYRALFAGSLAGVYLSTPEGKILECNEAMARMLGYGSPEELMKVGTPATYDDPDEREDILAQLEQFGSMRNCEVRLRTKSGEPIWCLMNSVLLDEGGKKVIQGTVVDITERKQATERLRTLARIAEQVGEGVAVATLDGVITFANAAWARMHGFSEEEIIGKHLSIFHTEAQLAKVKQFNEAVLRDGMCEGEVGHVTRDGTPFETFMVTTLLRNDDGEPIGFIGVARDITEKKQAEAELVRYQHELSLRNMLSEIFLTKEDEEMYFNVMELVRQTLDSQFGLFGYVDERGRLVAASLTHSVWDECQIPGKSLVFPPEAWGGLWGAALNERRTHWANEGLKVPEGHVALECAIATPIMHGKKLVGLFAVANKEGGYDEDDVRLLEMLAAHVAPVLDARLEQERAAERMKYRVAMEGALARVSRQFARAEGADLDEVMRTLGEAVGVDRAYIFRLSEGTIGDNTHEWRSSGSSLQSEVIRGLDLARFPWALAQFRAGRAVVVADTAKPPEGVGIDSEWELSRGARAVAVVPITSPMGDLEGVLGFEVEGRPREWQQEDIQALETVAEMLSTYWARERAERSVAQVTRELREIVDTANAPIIGVDTDGLVDEWNQKTEALTGYKRSEVLGKNLADELIDPEQVAAVSRVLYDAVVGLPTSNFELRLKTKSGKPVSLMFNAAARRDINGEVIGMLGVGQDITELIEYREELERKVEERTRRLEAILQETVEAHNRIDAILKSVADGLIVTDLYNRVVLMNRAAEEMLDVRLSEAIGLPTDFAIVDPTLRDRLRYTLDKRQEGYEFDFTLPSVKRKESRTFSARTSLIRDHSGEVSGIVTIIHDVTKEREIDRMKTDFVSTAAHELRTPLTTIQGFSEILLTRSDLDETQRKYLSYINNEAVALANIIGDLLDISRIESGKGFSLVKKHCDVTALFGRLVAAYRDRYPTHTFLTEFPQEPLELFVDPDKMQQVLDNLLSNAVKYSPDGGKITVSAREAGGETEIAVKDEGVGMTPEQVARIFDKFYRSDASNTAQVPGTGLGMTIVKHIVDTHGGTIEVESEPGKGTVVTIRLPRG